MDFPLGKRIRLEFDHFSSAPSIENQKKSIIIVWMSQTFGFGMACRQGHAACAKQVLFSPGGMVFPKCFSAAVHWQHLPLFLFRVQADTAATLRLGLGTPWPLLTVASVSVTRKWPAPSCFSSPLKRPRWQLRIRKCLLDPFGSALERSSREWAAL